MKCVHLFVGTATVAAASAFKGHGHKRKLLRSVNRHFPKPAKIRPGYWSEGGTVLDMDWTDYLKPAEVPKTSDVFKKLATHIETFHHYYDEKALGSGLVESTTTDHRLKLTGLWTLVNDKLFKSYLEKRDALADQLKAMNYEEFKKKENVFNLDFKLPESGQRLRDMMPAKTDSGEARVC